MHYPDFGPLKYRVLFECNIFPRDPSHLPNTSAYSPVNILFCNISGINPEEEFTANHFVPLIKHSTSKKIGTTTKRTNKSSSHTNIDCAKKVKYDLNPVISKNIYHYFKSPHSLNVVKSSSSSVVTSTCSLVTTTSSSIITSSPSHSLTSVVDSASNSTIFFEVSSLSSSSSIPSSSASLSSPLPSLSPLSSSTLPSSLPSDSFSGSTPASVSTSSKVLPSSAFDFEKLSAAEKYDISTFFSMSKKLSDKERYNCIVNCFMPDKKFNFPVEAKTSKSRPFLHKWLDEYDWLRYSKYANGGYCLPCSLFASSSTKFQKQERLVTKPVKGCNNAVTFFKRHIESPNGLHASCLKDMKSFLLRFEGKILPINTQVNNQAVREISKAKKILPAIIDTVLLCGHLGLPLRGHRDDSDYHPKAGEYSTEPGLGNFIDLLNFAIRRGDKNLKEHYQSHPGNASYFSKTTQNEFIKISGDLILENITSSIKCRPDYYFSVLADEAMDSSSKEQLSLVLRFLDESCSIREEFVGFVHLKDGLSGKAISDAILSKVSDLGLDISRCRGQGYDGAGSVSGKQNGAAAHILRVNRKALYTHCYSHRLNLAICKNFKIISVNNMMETVQKISFFFKNSEQRQRSFEKHVAQFCPTSSSKKLRDPCKTRWVERIKDLDLFIELFEPLWSTLESMKTNLSGEYNRNTQVDAFSFFKAIDNFDFIANLVITYQVLELSLLVTQLLQSKKNDLADGVHMIRSLINRVSSIRKNVDAFHDDCYEKITAIAKRLNIPISKPRTNKRQVYRDNHPANSISDFYKVSLTIPLLDTLEQELKSRFSNDTLACYSGLYLIPSKVIGMQNSPRKKPLKELCKSIISFYYEDLPYPSRIEAELDLWEEYWTSEREIFPTNFAQTLKAVDFTGFQNIKQLLKILATLTITSCECERSFSGMKRVKTCLRTTMGQERLNGLALLNFHLDKVPDLTTVCDRFLSLKSRLINK